jgi:hypothetical protein
MSSKTKYPVRECGIRLSRVGEKPSFGTYTPPLPYEPTSKRSPQRAPGAKSPRRRS